MAPEIFDPNVWYQVFIWGAVGALIVVYLRLWDVLPEVGGSEAIADLEKTLKQEQDRRHKLYDKKAKVEVQLEQHSGKFENLKTLLDAYTVQIRNLDEYIADLRSQTWKLKTRQFIVSAVLFVLLGGAVAVLLRPRDVFEAILFGAGWTSAASLVEYKAVASKDIKKAVEEKIREYETELKAQYEESALEAVKVATRRAIEEYKRLT